MTNILNLVTFLIRTKNYPPNTFICNKKEHNKFFNRIIHLLEYILILLSILNLNFVLSYFLKYLRIE